MLSAITKQVMAFTKFSRPSLILHLLLGGWLTFISQSTVVQAQINTSEVFIAQRRPSVYDGIPPAPPSNEPLPLLPSDPGGYTVPEVNTSSQRSIEFQAPQYQYNRDFAPYKVFVNDSDYGALQQVRRISPKAFRRQFRGRSVIQVGAFRTENGARNLARQLEFDGIRTARVVNNDRVVNSGRPYGREIPRYADSGYYGRDRSNYYYVVIPGNSEELFRYINEIRRYVGPNAYVDIRNEPRGPHVAVGPFTRRWLAEEWNSRLQDRGFSNARVYYGK